MVNANTMNWMYKVFVGAGVSATLGILTFMGNGIVNNDRENTKQHIEIRKEVDAKIEPIRSIVTDIRLEQMEQKVMLKGIAAKL